MTFVAPITVAGSWRRSWGARGALWFGAVLVSLPTAAAWAQTHPVGPPTSAAIASAVAGQLLQLAVAKATLSAAQRKVDSHLRRVAWPDHPEAQLLPPPVVLPPWHQGAWLHVYVKLDAAAPAVLDVLRAHGLAIERVNDDFAVVQGWITQPMSGDWPISTP